MDSFTAIQLNAYLEHIRKDYAGFMPPDTDVRKEMVAEFNKSVRVEEGRKYYKVIDRNSVHSFICKEDMGRFKRGDILKAASWAAPAKNFARGNILLGTWAAVRWTGA
jgi:hypothetical protein